MVFANLIFLYLFLPANLILYFVTKNQVFRNIVLVLFSFFFYAWGEPVWIIILFISATGDYFHGLWVKKYFGTPKAKWGVVSSLILNLGILTLFKYSGFLVANINNITGLGLPVPGFILPIGVSFYTFQTISYVVDVYRGDVQAQRNYMTFMLFVSLYHRLVAGPIVRYSEVEHEIGREQPYFTETSAGISRFCVGLVKKVVVANYAGQLAGTYLNGNLAELSCLGSWFGMLLYAIQLYYDFSGYSDMALGLGLMFGSHYNENFRYPYIARSVGEFWRRWHISLSGFFRDYVYIPLGGNRRFVYRNLLIVWFLTGLWHGANWNYIIWGLYYGALIMLERLFLRNVLDKLPRFLCHIYMIVIALVGWTFFYFEDMSRLGKMLSTMFGFGSGGVADLQLGLTFSNNIFWLVLAVAFCIPIVPWLKKTIETKFSAAGRCAVTYLQSFANVGMLLLCTAMLVGESYNPFLYFRF